MRHIEGEKMEELEFKWGKEIGTGKRKDVHFYESFTYDGEEYSLYDSVFMLGEWDGVPYVGKLVKIWEEADKSRKIKVQWFFRPSEISYFLTDVEVLENELFFGTGCGIGLANINPLEAIAGKCNVVCISTDNRNPQPSVEEVNMANYVFYRIFDVQSHVISDQMPCIIGGLRVEFVFNIKESDKAFNIPKFDSKRKYNARNTITCDETWRFACKSSHEQLESLKLSGNCNRLVEEEDTSATQVQTKKKSVLGEEDTSGMQVQGIKKSLLGETKSNMGSTSKRKCSSADVNSSKDAEPTNTTENRSTLDANVGYKVKSEEDQAKDVKSRVNQVNIEERVRFARNSSNLGDISLKGAKLVKTSSNDKFTHDVHGLTIPGSGNDAMPLMIGTTSYDANSKPKHTAGVVELEKVSNLAKDWNGLEKKLFGTNVIVSSEKAKSTHAQNFVSSQKDLKQSKSLSTCRKRPSMSNEVLAYKTSRFGSKEEFGEIGQPARFVEDSNALGKRPTKTRAYPSYGKPNLGQDFRCERENITLAYLSSPKEERPSKKAKLDSVNTFEVNNNAIQKLKGKSCASKMENYSPFTVSLNDNESKSKFPKQLGKLGKGRSKECYNDEMDKVLGGNLSKLSVPTSKGDDREVEGRIFEAAQRPIIGNLHPHLTSSHLSSPKEGPSNKAKLDDSVKTFEVNNNVIQKLKEKSCTSKMENYSPSIVSLTVSESKSRFPKQMGKLGKGRSKEYYNDEMDKLHGGNLSKLSVPTSKGDDREAEGRIFEATRRPIIEKSKWFKLKELSWEESVKTASDEGKKLVLLQNFDPNFTSGEVEDIVWHAFNEHCKGRMLQHTAISNPHYGQAIVIFRTSEVAESVVKKLDDGCLMLPNKRPLVGRTVVLPKLPGKQMTFVGHLCIDKVRRQPKKERKEAVSTSHYSQTNTIEYEMAMEWCLLQSKSDAWWQNLFEPQMEKLKKLMANLKSNCTSTAI